MSRSSKRSGITLGLGLGGFIDGIFLHQILQWHNMGSAVVPPTTMEAMKQNMIWDGEFHLVAWALTVAGVYMMFNDSKRGRLPRSSTALTGQMILGWGIFNLVEGVVDHMLLNIHHVRDVPVHLPVYDWVFVLAGGFGLIVVGLLLARETVRS